MKPVVTHDLVESHPDSDNREIFAQRDKAYRTRHAGA